MKKAKITILCIGKMKKTSPEAELIQNYIKSCPWDIEIKELEEKKVGTPFEIQQAQSELLLKNIPNGDFVIACDEGGKNPTSMELAEKLSNHAHITFLIGGADGHLDCVLNRADMILSFGKMTFPHMLFRVFLVEQIFRSYTIINHHPYHRE